MVGGPETEVGERKNGFNNIVETAQDCEIYVRAYDTKATGATYQPSNKRCWAEYGNKVKGGFETCKFEGKVLVQAIIFIRLSFIEFTIWLSNHVIYIFIGCKEYGRLESNTG